MHRVVERGFRSEISACVDTSTCHVCLLQFGGRGALLRHLMYTAPACKYIMLCSEFRIAADEHERLNMEIGNEKARARALCKAPHRVDGEPIQIFGPVTRQAFFHGMFERIAARKRYMPSALFAAMVSMSKEDPWNHNVAKISTSQAAKIGANYQPLLETLTWRP